MGAARQGQVAVVTGDIINSRAYHSAARARLNVALHRALDAIVPPTNAALARLDFRVTAGDEFQFVLGDTERALETAARKLKIRHQNVSKRLGAAGWPAVALALALKYIGHGLSHPKRVQPRMHPEQGARGS